MVSKLQALRRTHTFAGSKEERARFVQSTIGSVLQSKPVYELVTHFCCKSPEPELYTAETQPGRIRFIQKATSYIGMTENS